MNLRRSIGRNKENITFWTIAFIAVKYVKVWMKGRKMKIIDEIEETVVKLQVDMTDEEIADMLDYYNKNCTNAARTEMQVSWSVLDILKKRMDEEEKKPKKKKQRK